jgi:hypothetical protein
MDYPGTEIKTLVMKEKKHLGVRGQQATATVKGQVRFSIFVESRKECHSSLSCTLLSPSMRRLVALYKCIDVSKELVNFPHQVR